MTVFQPDSGKNITGYEPIYKEGISANTIRRVKHGFPISTKTLDVLCFVLSCRVEDIIEYVEDEQDAEKRAP